MISTSVFSIAHVPVFVLFINQILFHYCVVKLVDDVGTCGCDLSLLSYTLLLVCYAGGLVPQLSYIIGWMSSHRRNGDG